VKPAPALWGVVATFVLGLAGLFLPGAAGDIAAFAWLGAFPGLALARLLLPGAPAATRWTLGLALSPLVAAVAGWALLAAGQPLATAARIVAMAGWILYAGGEARLAAGVGSENDAPAAAPAWAWSLAAAAFVAIPLASSEWLRVRSDTWVHAGIVWEIVERGIPPEDPRFAGLPLNYVWFYNLFVALAGALRPVPAPFTTMAVANVTWVALLVWLGWQLAWCVWRERRPAGAALPLLLTGLNAGALALWPLWFLRALRGEVRGADEARRILAGAEWSGVDVMRQLSAPFAWMVNAWDKFMVGTALGYAYVLLLVWLWAGARWLADPRAERPPGAPPAWRWLVVAGAAAAGMMLFHSVVGLSVIPVSVGACLLLALLGRRGSVAIPPARALALAAAGLAGLAAAWPYFRSISGGWTPERAGFAHRYLQVDWPMPWTLLTACGLTVVVAWPGIRRVLAEQRVAGLWLAAWTLGMAGFAIVVHLPEGNESKFVWQVFAPLAILGGAAFPGVLAAWRARLGRFAAAALVVFLFVLPSALLFRGFLLDRSAATAPETRRRPGESALYRWVRHATPASAVFVDDHSRDVLLVEGRRRLLAGTPHAAERAAFPRDQLLRRRAVSRDLYGATADLPGDARLLDSLAAPAYVLYRDGEHAAPAPWAALEHDAAGFARVYAADGFRVYKRVPR
jgi:hypothetical protein